MNKILMATSVSFLLSGCGKFSAVVPSQLQVIQSAADKSIDRSALVAYTCDTNKVSSSDENEIKTCLQINDLSSDLENINHISSIEARTPDDLNTKDYVLCMDLGRIAGRVDQIIQYAHPVSYGKPATISDFRIVMDDLYSSTAKMSCYCAPGCSDTTLYRNLARLDSELETLNSQIEKMAEVIGLGDRSKN